MTNGPDVLVIGGGIIGLSAALALAEAGARAVVYDRGDLGREASWAGAGIIPPGNPDRAATPIDRLRAVTATRLPAFSADLRERTGIDNGYRRSGGIEFLQPHDEYALDLWRAEGVSFERLDSARLREVEPHFGDAPGTPYHLPDMAQVRNPWHLRALVAACQRAGVWLHPHTPAAGWQLDAGRVTGARFEDGTVRSAERYLLAAGAWADGLLGQLGCRPGVRPVRGQIAIFQVEPGHLGNVLLVGKEYLVPRADGVILAGSTEEPEAGFEKANTAAGLARLTAFARACVPSLGEPANYWAGLRPGSPDGLPFIGPVPGHPNVVAAAGHFRAGVQLSLGTAELVRDLILGRPTLVPPDSFRLDRVPDRSARPAFRS